MGTAPSKPESAAAPQMDEKLAQLQSMLNNTRLHNASGGEPLSADGAISAGNVEYWEESVSLNQTQNLARTIFSRTAFTTDLISRGTTIKDQHVFNTELPFDTNPITNQKSSGRCWLFATTNVLRYDVMKKLNLGDFQLSQSYLFFWDKLNKANYFLEKMIETADLPYEDRLVSTLTGGLISDGGQWDMAVNLLQFYGVVPQAAYPESFSSSSSGALNTLLMTKLREHADILRELYADLRSENAYTTKEIISEVRSKKEELMKDVWTIMTATLGVPPLPDTKFTWDYYDKDGKPQSWSGTPLDFYKANSSKQYPPLESFSLINDPRNKYGKLYTVQALGNVWNARPVLYVNTESQDLKDAVVKMIKAGQPVFFGCDVGKFSDRISGIMDTALYDYNTAFNITLGLTKTQRLLLNESAMTHAMVISAVHLDASGKAVRYKVENSWGEEPGEKGWFVMTDAWFDEFVYQVVVPRALAPKRLVSVFDGGKAIELPAWDPMGALA